MKFWLPVIFSLLVIATSTFIIKIHPLSVISLPVPTSSITPVTTFSPPTPTIIDSSDIDENYAKVYARCGELPNLSDYSPNRFKGNYSPKMWSPSCRFIAWSATIQYSFGKWSVSKYEGLFLYDLKTQKTSRLYTPTSESDSVVFLHWQDDTHFIFRKSIDNTDYIYDVTNQTFNKP